MESWNSYPKVYTLGHPAIAEIMQEEVLVQEKVDGSQFSFGKFDHPTQGEVLLCRSKGAQIMVDAPDNMFRKAVETAKELYPILIKGYTYRCEYLAKPKHNTLVYDRVPKKHLILFDVGVGMEAYAKPEKIQDEAQRVGLECVPVIGEMKLESPEHVREFLDRESILGGQKVEGVVLKNYGRFTKDGKPMFGKFVSEAFKEVHGREWKERNPKGGDVVQRIIDKFKTPARWNKAVQHLREAGKLEDSPKDIGKLMIEAKADIEAECKEEMAAMLWAWAWPKIQRGVIAGLPEWYKEELLKKQFE